MKIAKLLSRHGRQSWARRGKKQATSIILSMVTGSLSLTQESFADIQATVKNQKLAQEKWLPDAVAQVEPLHPSANKSYQVYGKRYYPLRTVAPFVQEGRASWYGSRFHGRKTASGERYDKNIMSAAHPTLPIPSYVRVTNLSNGESVVVRINDRGPFHARRIIDLSQAAAAKLGFLQAGTTKVRVEQIVPEPEDAKNSANHVGSATDVNVAHQTVNSNAGSVTGGAVTTNASVNASSGAGSRKVAAARTVTTIKRFDSLATAQRFLQQLVLDAQNAGSPKQAQLVREQDSYLAQEIH